MDQATRRMMALLGVNPQAAARWSEATPQAAGVSVVDSELRMYGPIMTGSEAEMWGEADMVVTDVGVVEALDGMEGDITVALNSPGGVVWAGAAIHRALSGHKGKVSVRVDGQAASVAALIAMAGDRIEMAEMSQMMIHGAWGCMCGNANEMRAYADLLDSTTAQMAGVLSKRMKGSKAKIAKMLGEGDHWYTGEEAVAAGLADAVLKAAKPKKDSKMAAAAAARATNLSMLLGTV